MTDPDQMNPPFSPSRLTLTQGTTAYQQNRGWTAYPIIGPNSGCSSGCEWPISQAAASRFGLDFSMGPCLKPARPSPPFLRLLVQPTHPTHSQLSSPTSVSSIRTRSPGIAAFRAARILSLGTISSLFSGLAFRLLCQSHALYLVTSGSSEARQNTGRSPQFTPGQTLDQARTWDPIPPPTAHTHTTPPHCTSRTLGVTYCISSIFPFHRGGWIERSVLFPRQYHVEVVRCGLPLLCVGF